ncbi:BQ2448_3579 [Microbotryum intermedium]|uniref:Pre-rRNA-processing protein n=1 Tax=Microbotryum intermedium TaxID=269621 RepID=A0A238FCB1_9BASI|nr:BQ2448_3579 [Microbotryum intermedium]
MAKSNKHKKARVADFAKAKLKLGKGKQVANNATNTNISSKRIGLPNQSLSEFAKTEPVSRRNHTLSELLVQSRHYSRPVRKEALLEIDQLLTSHPYLLDQHLLPLISCIAHLLPDTSAGVRASTRALFVKIADRLDLEALKGVSKRLILFNISSLSSLDQDIKVDALKVLDILLEKIPDEIVRGWDAHAHGHDRSSSQAAEGSLEDKGVGSKVVEALLGVLRVRNPGLAAAQGSFTSAASSDLSPAVSCSCTLLLDLSGLASHEIPPFFPQSRLAVLSTLARFLQVALSPSTPVASTSTSTGASHPWYFSSSFSSIRSYENFISSFPHSATSVTKIQDDDYQGHSVESYPLASENFDRDFSLDTLGLVHPPPAAYSTPSTTSASSPTLLSILHPTLLSTFLDAAPAAFSPTEPLSSSTFPSSDLAAVVAVVGVAQSLYQRELGRSFAYTSTSSNTNEARKSLVMLLGHAAAYFPFGSDDLRERSNEAKSQLLSLNLSFSALVSLLVLNDPSESAHASSLNATWTAGKKKKKTATKLRKQEELGSKFQLMVQNVEEWVIDALEGELKSTSQPLGMTLGVEAIEGLIPTIWALLNRSVSTSGLKSGVDHDRTTEKGRESALWKAVLYHFDKANAGGETKKLSFLFIARIVMLQSDPSYIDWFTIPTSSASSSSGSSIDKWLLSLPKYLWELGTKNPQTSEMVLTFLLKTVATLSVDGEGVFSKSTITSLTGVLAPFFHLSHPIRGSMYGPFIKLPKSSQDKAIALCWYLQRFPGVGNEASLKKGLELCFKRMNKEGAGSN